MYRLFPALVLLSLTSLYSVLAAQHSLVNQIVTHYYGHLSHRILVKPGDKVYCGEQIGEIAQHFTCNNGGYLAHLHLSIEKGSYENANIKGWSYSTENWYSPYSFIKEYSKRCKK